MFYGKSVTRIGSKGLSDGTRPWFASLYWLYLNFEGKNLMQKKTQAKQQRWPIRYSISLGHKDNEKGISYLLAALVLYMELYYIGSY